MPTYPTAATALATSGAGKLSVNTALGAQQASTQTAAGGTMGAPATSVTIPAVPNFYSQGILVVCVTG